MVAIAMTREMGTLGKDVAQGIADSLGTGTDGPFRRKRAQHCAGSRLDQLVGQDASRSLALLKRRVVGEQPHDPHASVDWNRSGVKYDVVKLRVFPVDTEEAPHDPRVSSIALLDLTAGLARILEF